MAKAKYKRNYRGVFETKIWDGTYNADGTKHRQCLSSSKSSADLERKVNILRAAIKNGEVVKPSNEYDFVSYAEHWLVTKKSVKELNTQTMYRNIINRHLNFLKGFPLDQITNSHIQQVINNAMDKPRTCQQIYLTARQIMSMAVCDGYLSQNRFEIIFRDISLPKYIKPEKRALTLAEKVALTEADFTPKEKAFVDILYGCGLRRGEALALTIFDFDFKTSTVSINKAVIFDGNNPIVKPIPKTDNGIRTIPIPKALCSSLAEYTSALEGTTFFTMRNGKPITKSSYRKMWESIVRKMNIAAGGTESFPVITDLTAHIFRHNYCSNLCYQVPAISIKKIAQLMGDTERMVLDVYNHIIEEKESPAEVVEIALAL